MLSDSSQYFLYLVSASLLHKFEHQVRCGLLLDSCALRDLLDQSADLFDLVLVHGTRIQQGAQIQYYWQAANKKI